MNERRKLSLNNLPVVDLTKENVESEWNGLIEAIRSSSFVSIDVEMSGLGNRKSISVSSIDERYKNLVHSASVYSVLSLGVSCFQISDEIDGNGVPVFNKTYNMYTLCSEGFMIEPDSIKFLIDQGFDFNKHFSNGIAYQKGDDKQGHKEDHARRLVSEIIKSNVPIVLHNGFIDLIFIYQNFYANCPENLMKFVADVSEMFSAGIYDTKFIAEFHQNSKNSATFLEYLYKWALYENTQFRVNQKPYIDLLLDSEARLDEHRNTGTTSVRTDNICTTFSTYGYCAKRTECSKSHNVNEIIELELSKRKSGRGGGNNKSTKKLKVSEDAAEENAGETDKCQEEEIINKVHSAGLDAFMTGYVMLNAVNKVSKFRMENENEQEEIRTTNNRIKLSQFTGISSKFKSNVYLTGKDYPLMIVKSNFSSCSSSHNEKRMRLSSTASSYV